MSDRDRDEVLRDMLATPPALPESEEEVRGGRLPLDEGVVFQGRTEVLVVAEDARGVLPRDGLGFLAGRGRV